MRKAFSLMEILVPVVIIASLLVVVLPVFSQTRARARQSACASNLRQLGAAALQYATDHDGAMPLTSHSSLVSAWGVTLHAYGATPALRLCPDDPQAGVRRAHKGTSYAWNENLLPELALAHDSGTSQGVHYGDAPGLEWLSHPSQTLLLVEQSGVSGTDDRGDHIHNRAWRRFPDRLLEMLQSDLALTRHPGGVLATCADGHLHHFPPGQLEAQARQGHDPLRLSF